jgi:Predicted permease
MINKRAWWWTGGLAISIALLYLLSPVLMPFLAGAIIAYLFDPIVNRLQALKLPRTLAVILVFILILLIVFLLLGILIPLLQQQVMELINRIPDMIVWIQATLIPWVDEHMGITTNFDANSLKNVFTSNLAQTGSIATVAWKTLFSSSKTLIIWFANLLIIPVVIFYLLRDWNKVTRGLHSLLPRRNERAIIKLFTECDDVLGAFLRGQLLVMLALGFLYSLGLTLIGLKMGLLIGLLAGILCIVPYLGFIVGIGAALIAAIFQFGDILHCVYVVIVFIIAQSIEASVFDARVSW